MSGAQEIDSAAIPSRDMLLSDTDALVTYLTLRLGPLTLNPIAAEDTAALERAALWRPHPDPRFAGKPPRQAAVLAPLYARDGKPHLLFTRRAADLRAHSGEISFPGGSRDPDDLSLAHTALRETYEELGIGDAHVTLLGSLPPEFTVVSNFIVTAYIGYLGAGLPPLQAHEAEVAEIIEAPLSALDDESTYHAEVWTRGGESHTVHFYDFGRYRIWGLTGRMLHQLLALLPPRAA